MSGSLFIVAAPSGAGKTSLVKALAASMADIRLSISHTTRPPRPGEQDGMDYHFVTEAIFETMEGGGGFLEHAQVFGHRYGTAKESVLPLLAQGMDVILEIDWQGRRQVQAQFPHCVSIFILPPSRETLEHRLRLRGQDTEAVVARRMGDACAEISHYNEFDYLVVNDDFEVAHTDLRAIVQSRRLLRLRQEKRLKSLLGELLE
ncbi:guanylate kinase [Nitrosococcus oceani]|uniref:Guanylate kinase n=2 Tax=Nitrosococcus oceani TaxID=1229 RepID=KGUA_NITOC|nr:guanylate kinase [Nitrosococcus oceani]Q3JBT3.1 RecName: Full=Guanylate kinase; AltName: Full=GMP kinase [Nitrosococcus oceani ATCC 19707]KFI19883.1 guanylate kinase [Nitrosococcus oceani C-27]ABA57713.1 guanylate kinase [Nitrosococcus oceani ATCC 19707]EDZ67414.1 guanylate kinase [Nitrosococcus oceani AFC27]KFI23036.1 guanylate kinase [Nitrosococcus oceani]GEM19366.1 guanylate kinase [Nitrosococcus oceani]